MFRLTIEAETFAEFGKKATELANWFHPTPDTVPEVTDAHVIVPEYIAVEPEQKPVAKTIDISEVRAAMKALQDAKGREAALGILTMHNAAKLGDLKPEEYATVIEEANAYAAD